RLFRQRAVGPIQSQAAFLLHDLAFGVERILVDFQKAHALGFQPQGQFQLVRRQYLDINSLVKAGVGVAVASATANEVEMILGTEAVRAAKHHVLEHVGKALAFGPLVLGTDVIPQMDRDNGARPVFQGDDLKAVGQGDGLVVQERFGIGPDEVNGQDQKKAHGGNGRAEKASWHESSSESRGLKAIMWSDYRTDGARIKRVAKNLIGISLRTGRSKKGPFSPRIFLLSG